MKNSNTAKLCRAGVVAALYITLTYAFAPVAFGPLQIRPAEALCILPLLFAESVWALFVGCFLSNLLMSPYAIFDAIFGSIATLLAAFCTFYIGKKAKTDKAKLILGGIPPVLFNTLVIPLVIVFLSGDSAANETLFVTYLSIAFSIFLTETVCVYGFGIPLYNAIIKNSKIKTDRLNSSLGENKMKLGNVLIIGDSYSTFENCVPNGYDVWYYLNNSNDRTDVIQKEQTWWSQLISETDSTLVLNESFSGTTVCNTERPTIPQTSFIIRLQRLIDGGFFKDNAIDTVFVFGGTNDSWIDAPLGEIEYENFNENNLKEVFPAFAYLIKTLQTVAPTAKIVSVINCDIKQEIIEGFEKISRHYGVASVTLQNIGKQNGHPNQAGMTQIKDQILAVLNS